jgi:hypothetical protein
MRSYTLDTPLEYSKENWESLLGRQELHDPQQRLMLNFLRSTSK